VQWRIEKRRLFFEFNVPEYHTAEIFPDLRVCIFFSPDVAFSHGAVFLGERDIWG
jgi:hypothetical protein